MLLLRGISLDEGMLGQKRKMGELRSLGLPEVDRGPEMLARFDATTVELDPKIPEAFPASKEARLLETIPGIGVYTAEGVVAGLGPINRFANIEKLDSYAGLVPTDHPSGETSYQAHLETDRNHLVKWLLVEGPWSQGNWADTGECRHQDRASGRPPPGGAEGKCRGSSQATENRLRRTEARDTLHS